MGVLTRRQRGMSLIELLVAVALLAIVVLSVIALFSESVRLNASGYDYTRVNAMARDKLEDLLGAPFASSLISLDPNTTEKVFPDDQPADSPMERTYAVREYRLSKSGDAATDLSTPVMAGDGNVKQISVTVRSKRGFLIGRREVTVSALKVDGLQ